MATKFSPGEWVVIKSEEEIRAFPGYIFCGWNDNMYELCGKSFRITDVEDYEHGQILKGLDTGWTISSDMVVSMSRDVAPVAFKAGDTVRIKSLEEIHRIIADGNNRYLDDSNGMRKLCGQEFTLSNRVYHDGASVGGYYVHKDFLEPVVTTGGNAVPRSATTSVPEYIWTTDTDTMAMHSGDPAPEKKKSRIQFSKIR